MDRPIGGRGKVAPYQTTHVRVPVPIKDKVQKLIDVYRHSLDSEAVVNEGAIPVEQAKEMAIKLIKSKTSKVETIAKLLTSIYGLEITKEELQ